MSCIFKKQKIVKPKSSFGDFMAYELQPLTKEVEKDGVVEKSVKFERIPLSMKTENADIPSPENYELREMLKQGYVPQEVSVSGMLDNLDSQDTDAIKIVENLSSKLNLQSVNNEIVENKE